MSRKGDLLQLGKSVWRRAGCTPALEAWFLLRSGGGGLCRLGWQLVGSWKLAFRVGSGRGFPQVGTALGAALLTGWTQVAQAAADSAELEGLNPLQSWKADLALWTAVVFLVLLAVLWKYAWGPIVQALKNRERAIADEIAQAQRQQQEAQELLAQYRNKLAHTDEEVQRMLEEARRQAEQTSRQILQQAHEKNESERQKMLQELDRAKQEAIREVSEVSALLAVQLAGKILQAELRPERHVQLIRQSLTELDAAPPSRPK